MWLNLFDDSNFPNNMLGQFLTSNSIKSKIAFSYLLTTPNKVNNDRRLKFPTNKRNKFELFCMYN